MSIQDSVVAAAADMPLGSAGASLESATTWDHLIEGALNHTIDR